MYALPSRREVATSEADDKFNLFATRVWSRPNSQAAFTRYNRLSNPLSKRFSNRFDNRLYRVYKHSTGCQTRLTTGLTKRLYRVYNRLSNRLYNRIDNRLYRVNRGSLCMRARLLTSGFRTFCVSPTQTFVVLTAFETRTY